MLVDRFQAAYKPGENIVVDESLLLFKGRLSWKQFIRTKRARFGMKTFELCDSETGYLYNTEVYCGASSDQKDATSLYGKSGEVVLRLCENLLNTGRTLHLDNYYTSPLLCEKLYALKTNVRGTVRMKRKYMPQDDEIKQMKKKMKKGDMIVRHNDKMMFCAWKDKRIVTLLTTCDKPELLPTNKVDYKTGNRIIKPNVVLKYNTYMGGVDLVDQVTQCYSSTRRTYKWYVKLFFSMLDKTIYNYLVIYKALHAQNITYLKMREMIINGLLEKYYVPNNHGTIERHSYNAPMRLRSRCFTDTIPPTNKKNFPTKRCVICTKNGRRKETRYCCQFCDVALCVTPCFRLFHTQADF